MPAPNDLVTVTETTLNTTAVFKPSEFISAYISWTQPFRPTDVTTPGSLQYLYPFVVINTTKNPPEDLQPSAVRQQPQYPVRTITLGFPYNSGGEFPTTNGLTPAQASTALASVYSAVNAYYTAVNS
jgi:hypothetical protein